MCGLTESQRMAS